MHHIAVFSHAFKLYENSRPVAYRIAYKIYDSKARNFASVYFGPVLSAHTASSNQPMVLAVAKALADPVFDKIETSRSTICLFTNHELVHKSIQKYILTNKPGSIDSGPYGKSLLRLFTLINRQKTVSSWNNCRPESDNKCKFVLKGVEHSFNDPDESFFSDVELPRNWHKDAIELACKDAIKRFADHFLRVNKQDTLLDTLQDSPQKQLLQSLLNSGQVSYLTLDTPSQR